MSRSFLSQDTIIVFTLAILTNGTIIPTYGQKLLQLDLGFHRVFQWPFIFADMDTFIIGFSNTFQLAA